VTPSLGVKRQHQAAVPAAWYPSCCARQRPAYANVSANMKVLRALLALLLLPSGVALAAITENVTPLLRDIEVIRAEFGLFNPPETGKPPFVPSKTVPLTENQAYGWVILLKTTKARIKWREEFMLPSPPATWGSGELQSRQSISEDRRVSVIEREVEPDEGMIFNVWDVAPGDPAGRYVIRVIIDDTLERVFEFDVQ
jgi:hypothetical protein